MLNEACFLFDLYPRPLGCSNLNTAECTILALVEDGVVKEVKGNPSARGKMCVKGLPACLATCR